MPRELVGDKVLLPLNGEHALSLTHLPTKEAIHLSMNVKLNCNSPNIIWEINSCDAPFM